MWFLFATIGYFLLAVAFVLDKRVLAKNVPNPAVYTFYSTIFLLFTLLLYPFGGQLLQTGADWMVALGSGVAFGCGLWTMFVALTYGEASHINPFNGAVITIATYAIASMSLSEHLLSQQIFGMVILVFSALLLSFEVTTKGRVFHKGYLWATLSGILFAASHVCAKIIYEQYDFMTGFVWTRTSIGFVGIAVLSLPQVRSVLFGKKDQKIAQSHGDTLWYIVSAKGAGIASSVILQYAMFLGSVTLVNALSGMQYVWMFLLIMGLTKFAPTILSEFTTKKEVTVQIIALLLVCIGSALFVL